MATHGRPRFHLFERISQRAAEFTGGSWAFIVAAGLVLAWLVTGPLFGFSNSWHW
jgi:low affinity Fe/Cu permease